MRTTWNGLRFVAQREACVLVAYLDSKEGEPVRYSIGFGRNGVAPDATCTIPQAFEWFREDIAERERQLQSMVRVPLLQCQWDSLLSLLYNWGSGNLRASDLLRELNEGRYGKAADLITTVKNHTPGLMSRRLLEREMFLNSDYGEPGQFRLYRVRPVKGENTPFEWQDFPSEEEWS